MKGIIENRYFDEIYSLIICLISVLCWKFSSMVGVIFLLIIGIFTLLVIKNIVYCIPLIFNMIFINNNDFVMGEIPYLMIFCGLAFFVSLIICIAHSATITAPSAMAAGSSQGKTGTKLMLQ